MVRRPTAAVCGSNTATHGRKGRVKVRSAPDCVLSKIAATTGVAAEELHVWIIWYPTLPGDLEKEFYNKRNFAPRGNLEG